MVAVVKLIADIAIWLYLGLAVVGILLLRAVQVALNERSQSIFDLERERATVRLNKNLFYLLIVLVFAGGIFYTSTELVKAVPIPVEVPTPTALIALPDTPTPPPLLPTQTPTRTPTPRPDQPLADAINTPAPPPGVGGNEPQTGVPPNCPLPNMHISQPFDGATVSGVIPIIGAARVENFSYYKIEFRVPGQDEWSFIESHETPRGEGLLASWNTATVPPGAYDFQLVVVDATGNFPKPCQIRLNVVR